jgi:hypothetical protein
MGTPPRKPEFVFRPRPPAARRRNPSLVDVDLDPAQRAAVGLPAGVALLVLGEAGHGKTTVALHRLAHIWRSSPRTLRAAVVVPTDGLARLLQPLLRKLGVDVEVETYDRWASTQARRAFRRLPRESDSTPPGVMGLKRHPALRTALEELGARPPGRLDDDVPERQRGAKATRADLLHLFGDRTRLERVARLGGIAPRAVLDTLERTHIQFSGTTEQEWAHVTDRQRLVAVDRRPIDDGTAFECADTVDVEDYAVLFELDRMRAERSGHRTASRQRYDVLMIDEAQEIAPLELALLGRTLKPEGTLIVAGDAQQQTDQTSTFLGWASTMHDLGRPRHEIATLDIGYRCPPEVVRLARSILAASGPAAPDGTGVLAFDTEQALARWAAQELRHLQGRDRRASIAVLCRSPRRARRVASSLQAQECPARLVFDGRFLPRGVQVTTVDEVKGLEFDFVLIPDAAAEEYPPDDFARRALYVAVTRARHQVVMARVGPHAALDALAGPTRTASGRERV